MKVLRSSPHCCVDEIRRMRMAEEGNNQRLEQKLDRSDGSRIVRPQAPNYLIFSLFSVSIQCN